MNTIIELAYMQNRKRRNKVVNKIDALTYLYIIFDYKNRDKITINHSKREKICIRLDALRKSIKCGWG